MSARRRHLATAFAALLIAGCGGSDDNDNSAPPEEADTPPAEEQANSEPQNNESEAAKIWLTTGEQLKPVERELDDPEAAAKALVKGPTGKEEGGNLSAATEIPAGVQVEGVKVEDDGTAVVEVSKDFLKGVPADPAARDAAQEEALDARLSQVTYTLTQFDDVDSAKVVAGGITTGPPRDRSDFEKPQGGPPPIKKPKGSYSSGTAAVQQKLANLGYLPPGAVDGLNGYRTPTGRDRLPVMGRPSARRHRRSADPSGAPELQSARSPGTRALPRGSRCTARRA